jgi:hypothetical protein
MTFGVHALSHVPFPFLIVFFSPGFKKQGLLLIIPFIFCLLAFCIVPHNLLSLMKHLLLFLFYFYIESIHAQNLVPNPSFEDTITCPLALDQMYNAVGWFSYRNSPDYLNACGNQYQNFSAAVPYNPFGYQQAYDGDAYAFTLTYFINYINYREYIGAQLLQPLSPGTKYFVSAFVSRAYNLYLNCATSNFGFRFSTVAYSVINPAPIDNFSSVHCDSVIKDTTNWVQVGGSFIADSAYQFIILGNFYDDAHTDTFGCSLEGGYYIDFVCVSTDSLSCKGMSDGVNGPAHSSLVIFPVPADKILIVNGIMRESIFSIFNYIGQICLYGTISENRYQINVSLLPDGFYFFQVGHSAPQKILIIHSP